MIIEEKEQTCGEISRQRRKRKKILPRILFLLISCIICFFIGQAVASILQAMKL